MSPQDKTLPVPFDHVRLDGAGSTNDEARRLVLSGAAADLLVVSAIHQNAGRGRRGRAWVSPAGNLHFSFLLDVAGRLPEAAQLGFAASAALVDALAEVCPQACFAAKWPNDVLAGLTGEPLRKCSGMLLEAVGRDWLIIGIGVNVVAAPPPGETLYPVAALADLGYEGDDLTVLLGFCRHFLPRLRTWRAQGFKALRADWLARARGVGEAVVVRLENETLSGVFAGIDDDGALLLENDGADATGSVPRRIMAGDVFFPQV